MTMWDVLRAARTDLPPGALELACHAAVPVAVDTGFLHLLRINFFQDPPEALPYETEAAMLTSPLFQELGDDLYEVDPALRDRLLAGLVAAYGPDRLTKVAVLLEQYTNRAGPWPLRELDYAQRLTALSIVHPDRAATWLTQASRAAAVDDPLAKEWFVAMRGRLDQRPPDLDAEMRSLFRDQDFRALGELALLPGADVLAIARYLSDAQGAPADLLRQVLSMVPPPRQGRNAPYVKEYQPLLPLLGADDLSDLARLRDRSPRDHLRVPIGVHDGQPVFLDLKDPAQGGSGPHGLIIGSTGAGKTELLRTLVLSLAITHSPADVTFAFVDIRSGASFVGFERLPHTAAMLTGIEDPRGQVGGAIRAELTRRQQRLAEGGERDHRTYQRVYQRGRALGSTLPPMPSLVIVIDDHADLVTLDPSVVDDLVSVGRVGRSLGVHLILCGQRWEPQRFRGLETHLGFRIGLRMFSEAESRTVLGDGSAAELPNEPGRGFLKPAGDELIPFRAAYVSGPHGMDVSWADLLDGPNPASEASWIVDRLAAHDAPTPRIWPPREAEPTTLGGVLGSASVVPGRGLQVADAERPDLPLAVLPGGGPNTVRWVRVGHHIMISGPAGSGKTTALETLVCGLTLTRTPAEAELFLFPMDDRGLARLAPLPHVRVVAGLSDPVLVYNAFADLGYRLDARSGPPAGRPSFVVVDGLNTLLTYFPDLTPIIDDIRAKGHSRNVRLIASTRELLLWGGNNEEQVQLGLMPDASLGLMPLLPTLAPDDRSPGDSPEQVARRSAEAWTGGRPERVADVLPEIRSNPDATENRSRRDLSFAVGVELLTPTPERAARIDLHGGLVIEGETGSGKSAFLRLLATTITRRLTAEEAQVVLIDPMRSLADVREVPGRDAGMLQRSAAPDLSAQVRLVNETAAILNQRGDGWQHSSAVFVLVDNYEMIASSDPLEALRHLLPGAINRGLHLVIAHRPAAELRMDPTLALMYRLNSPALIMSQLQRDDVVHRGVPPLELPPGMGRFVAPDGRVRTVQLAYLPPDDT